jgi:hypothetical protein
MRGSRSALIAILALGVGTALGSRLVDTTSDDAQRTSRPPSADGSPEAVAIPALDPRCDVVWEQPVVAGALASGSFERRSDTQSQGLVCAAEGLFQYHRYLFDADEADDLLCDPERRVLALAIDGRYGHPVPDFPSVLESTIAYEVDLGSAASFNVVACEGRRARIVAIDLLGVGGTSAPPQDLALALVSIP